MPLHTAVGSPMPQLVSDLEVTRQLPARSSAPPHSYKNSLALQIWWCCARSVWLLLPVCKPGKRQLLALQVVAFRYGQFSHLWIDMLQRLGLDVHVIEERWGDGAHEDKLEKVGRVLGLWSLDRSSC